MSEMIDALGTLRETGTPVPADADTVAADVARGRRALAGRLRRRIAGTGLVAAAAVAAVTVGVAGQSGGSGASVAAQQTTHAQHTTQAKPTTQAQPTTQLQLTAYAGAQPVGFRVATVPRGWRVISSDKYDFVAVPPGTNIHQQPGFVDFTHGIAVTLQGQSRLPAREPVTKVTVRGRAGQLGLTQDKQAEWLIYPDAAGKDVLVQVPVKLHLTNDQIVRFAQGVTVTSDAHESVG